MRGVKELVGLAVSQGGQGALAPKETSGARSTEVPRSPAPVAQGLATSSVEIRSILTCVLDWRWAPLETFPSQHFHRSFPSQQGVHHGRKADRASSGRPGGRHIQRSPYAMGGLPSGVELSRCGAAAPPLNGQGRRAREGRRLSVAAPSTGAARRFASLARQGGGGGGYRGIL